MTFEAMEEHGERERERERERESLKGHGFYRYIPKCHLVNKLSDMSRVIRGEKVRFQTQHVVLKV